MHRRPGLSTPPVRAIGWRRCWNPNLVIPEMVIRQPHAPHKGPTACPKPTSTATAPAYLRSAFTGASTRGRVCPYRLPDPPPVNAMIRLRTSSQQYSVSPTPTLPFETEPRSATTSMARSDAILSAFAARTASSTPSTSRLTFRPGTTCSSSSRIISTSFSPLCPCCISPHCPFLPHIGCWLWHWLVWALTSPTTPKPRSARWA